MPLSIGALKIEKMVVVGGDPHVKRILQLMPRIQHRRSLITVIDLFVQGPRPVQRRLPVVRSPAHYCLLKRSDEGRYDEI